DGSVVVKQKTDGMLPELDRFVSSTSAGSWLAKLIEQSGVPTTPATLIVTSIGASLGLAFINAVFVRQPIFLNVSVFFGGILPLAYVKNRRSKRLHVFEEQFPEALDLLSRALRAGHAFQTAMGMIADEMKPPIGPEFKKTFDQQNYGLPLRDALNELTER